MNTELIIIIVVIIGLALIFLIAKSKTGISSEFKARVYNNLSSIKHTIENGSSIAYRDSLIRLDTELSKVLQKYFGNKESCGENLKRIKGKVSKDDLNNIWKYHKLRNSAVHENIDISYNEISSAYKVFRSLIAKILN